MKSYCGCHMLCLEVVFYFIILFLAELEPGSRSPASEHVLLALEIMLAWNNLGLIHSIFFFSTMSD